MSITRRDFIKEAAVVSTVVASGVSSDLKDVEAEVVQEEKTESGTERCPYFDQPLLCRELTPGGKYLCDE